MSPSKKLLLALSVFAAALLVPELALRAAGWPPEPGSGLRFGWPPPDQMEQSFVPHPELFWTLPPDTEVTNSLGFPGREVEVPKPSGVYRVLFLGDSCTFRGYPLTVEAELNARRADGRRYEAVALAVPGYTSHQGLRTAELFAERMQGDLAFAYFGWNDHWLARGSTDRDKARGAPTASSPEPAWRRLVSASHLVRAARELASAAPDATLDVQRVPPEDFRANLLALHAHLAALDVPLVLITAPTSYYDLGVQKETVEELRLVASKEEAVRLHRLYCEIVREVARATGAPLLDLEREYAGRDDLPAIFRRDGIHFTAEGSRLTGERIASFIEERFLRAE